MKEEDQPVTKRDLFEGLQSVKADIVSLLIQMNPRVSAIETKLETFETKLDTIETKLETLEKDTNEGFLLMSTNFCWMDRRLARFEELNGLTPSDITLWGANS